jgi:hypothetical protein
MVKYGEVGHECERDQTLAVSGLTGRWNAERFCRETEN